MKSSVLSGVARVHKTAMCSGLRLGDGETDPENNLTGPLCDLSLITRERTK